MNSYRFSKQVMCDGKLYLKDSVHTLTEQDALNFEEAVTQVPGNDSSVNGEADSTSEPVTKVASAHPNKMMKSKKQTTK